MANIPNEEKKEATLNEMIAYGKNRHFYTLQGLTNALKPRYSETVLRNYVRLKYDKTLVEYLVEKHGLLNVEECRQCVKNAYEAILKKHSGKPPIRIMRLDDIGEVYGGVFDEILGENDFGIRTLAYFLFDTDVPFSTIARQLKMDGVVISPVETEEEKRNLVQSVIEETKKDLLSKDSDFYTRYGNLVLINHKYAFYNDVRLIYPQNDFYGQREICEWIKEFYNETPREFYEKNDLLCTKEELEKVIQQQFDIIKEISKGERPVRDLKEFGDFLDNVAYGRSYGKKIQSSLKASGKKLFIGISWIAKYHENFIVTEVMEYKERLKYVEQLLKQAGIINEELAAVYFDIYADMGKVNISALLPEGENCKYPKKNEYVVVINGKEFHVKTAWPRIKEVGSSYDAYSAIDTMLSVEEARQKVIDLDPNMHSDAAFLINSPEFDFGKCLKIDEIETRRRMAFIVAVANLLDDQETMEAIIQTAEKKKNGSLYKGRILRIASSGVVAGDSSIYAIVGYADSDYVMTITCREVNCKPGDNEIWSNDFISTPHEGLRITEALKKLNNNNSL